MAKVYYSFVGGGPKDGREERSVDMRLPPSGVEAIAVGEPAAILEGKGNYAVYRYDHTEAEGEIPIRVYRYHTTTTLAAAYDSIREAQEKPPSSDLA